MSICRPGLAKESKNNENWEIANQITEDKTKQVAVYWKLTALEEKKSREYWQGRYIDHIKANPLNRRPGLKIAIGVACGLILGYGLAVGSVYMLDKIDARARDSP